MGQGEIGAIYNVDDNINQGEFELNQVATVRGYLGEILGPNSFILVDLNRDEIDLDDNEYMVVIAQTADGFGVNRNLNDVVNVTGLLREFDMGADQFADFGSEHWLMTANQVQK